MSVKIGQASIDENGKVSNGNSGDSTTKEVYIRDWYNKPWQYYIECIDEVIAKKAATYMEQICNNNNVGYDQSQRLTLYKQLKANSNDVSKISSCETDCSALVSACYIMAGINISPSCTTRNIRSALIATSKFKVYSNSEYLTTDKYAKIGGIYLKEGGHVVMALENGSENDVTIPTTTSTTYTYGIDISANQGTIDFAKVAKAGVKFAVLRSTLSSGKVDSKFAEYLSGCDKNGISVSTYKYSYAKTVTASIAEANQVISLLNGRKMKVWLDLENANQVSTVGKAGITKIANAFISTLENAGYEVGLYFNLNWYKNYIDSSLLKHDYWIARYGLNNGKLADKYKPNVGEMAWQYSSRGKVDGIKGNVDLDVFYGSIDNSKTDTTTTTTSIEIKNTVNVKSTLNVRKIPNSLPTTPVVKKLSNGEEVDIIGYKNGWYKIGEDKWVSADYISTSKGRISASCLNIRSDADKTSKDIGDLKNGEIVNVLDKKNEWYLIQIDSRFGWASSSYIIKH